MAIAKKRIRLALDTAHADEVLDKITTETPWFWRGTDLRFELGVFINGTISDLANATSLTLEIKPYNARTGDALITGTTASFSVITGSQWTADTHQNAVIEFASTATAPAMDGANERDLWFVVSVETSDVGKVTLGAGKIVCREDGTGSESSPTPTADYYTAAQSDARYVMRAEANANFKVANGRILLWDPTAYAATPSTPWRALGCDNGMIVLGEPEA